MLISSLSQATYGDIILFEPTSVKGRIQVWGDNLGQERKFNLSHGALYLGKEGNTHLMLESVTGCGVHIAKVQEWANYTIVRPDLPVRPKKEMYEYLNARYDFSKIRAVMFNRLFGLPLTVDDDSQVICTELINLAYYYALTPKGMCTPVTLANEIL